MKLRASGSGASPDVRGQLLDAAVRLFAEQGVAGTTVADIARPVGVTSAMVHYYFKTKDQLLDAVVEEKLIGDYIAFVAGALARGADSPTKLVERLVWRIIEASERMPWLPPLWVREVLSEGGTMREKLIRRVDLSVQTRFKARVAAAQRAGEVNPQINAQLLFVSVVGLTLLPLSLAKRWGRIPLIDKISKKDLGHHVVALLMNGLVASRSSRRRKRRAS